MISSARSSFVSPRSHPSSAPPSPAAPSSPPSAPPPPSAAASASCIRALSSDSSSAPKAPGSPVLRPSAAALTRTLPSPFAAPTCSSPVYPPPMTPALGGRFRIAAAAAFSSSTGEPSRSPSTTRSRGPWISSPRRPRRYPTGAAASSSAWSTSCSLPGARPLTRRRSASSPSATTSPGCGSPSSRYPPENGRFSPGRSQCRHSRPAVSTGCSKADR
ncbi:hypothetical protein PR202_gb03373 [Eleusine coracana subsp. coracana]|uniref:Uncharacterized protein n=1 Tax=Eleusine coracana subsp. coracana TaxID=191504 RepID=A0AAV5E2N6_ELECO|nr:hypothetical protein PR202_gb03373 [Eleusine coracana subsp. coracana]